MLSTGADIIDLDHERARRRRVTAEELAAAAKASRTERDFIAVEDGKVLSLDKRRHAGEVHG